jgi:Zn finger protein HypA/HybF involved in hydrogenase expression
MFNATRETEMTINERLDAAHPFECDACKTPLKRAAEYYPICPACGLNVRSGEAWAIRRARQELTKSA